MATDFEVVTSGSWVEVVNATSLVDSYPGGELEVLGFIFNKSFAFIDSVLEPNNLVPVGYTVVDAKILPTEDIPGERLRMWIKLGPA